MKAVGVFPAERRFEVVDHPEPAILKPTQVKLRMLEAGEVARARGDLEGVTVPVQHGLAVQRRQR